MHQLHYLSRPHTNSHLPKWPVRARLAWRVSSFMRADFYFKPNFVESAATTIWTTDININFLMITGRDGEDLASWSKNSPKLNGSMESHLQAARICCWNLRPPYLWSPPASSTWPLSKLHTPDYRAFVVKSPDSFSIWGILTSER